MYQYPFLLLTWIKLKLFRLQRMSMRCTLQRSLPRRKLRVLFQPLFQKSRASPFIHKILYFIGFLFQHFQSIGADRRANSAVMPLVILKVVFLFPLITCPHIQDLFTWQSWIPCVAFQCFCRAGFYAAITTPAEISLYWRPTRKFNVGENGSQSNP
jgi:hypothetical protein